MGVAGAFAGSPAGPVAAKANSVSVTAKRRGKCFMNEHGLGGTRTHNQRLKRAARWTCKQLERAVHEQLASWFCEVYDKAD